MKESFEELIDALKKTRIECPWSKDQKIEEHMKELHGEVKEAFESIKQKDHENLKEELGDILMDLMFVSILAEEKKLFTVKEMIDDVKEKLIRRKPWVFGNEKIRTKEEAVKRWNEIKEIEKQNKDETRNI